MGDVGVLGISREGWGVRVSRAFRRGWSMHVFCASYERSNNLTIEHETLSPRLQFPNPRPKGFDKPELVLSGGQNA